MREVDAVKAGGGRGSSEAEEDTKRRWCAAVRASVSGASGELERSGSGEA